MSIPELVQMLFQGGGVVCICAFTFSLSPTKLAFWIPPWQVGVTPCLRILESSKATHPIKDSPVAANLWFSLHLE